MPANGKIASLPRQIREQLNNRLDHGEDGPILLAWLNGLPEVKAVVAHKFGGWPINGMNLNRWREGKFRRWQDQQGQALEKPMHSPLSFNHPFKHS